MGRVIKDAKVKVPSAAGPLKKGLPLSTVVGQGGLYNLFRGKPVTPNMKIPGFKSLMMRGAASGKLRLPPGQE